MRKTIAISFIVLFNCLGAYSSDFLTGARGAGLGFSYFVLGDDPSGALYNPSALGYAKGWQSQLSYNKIDDYGFTVWDENPYYGTFGAVYYKPEWGGFALNSIQSGSFAEPTAIPTVNYMVFSYGREFSPGLAMGASAKYQAEYGFLERSAFDFDAAVTYRTRSGIIMAASVENMARSYLKPANNGFKEYLPRRSRVGLGYAHDAPEFRAAFTAAGQMEESGYTLKETTALFNIGTEWWFNQYGDWSFGARTGFSYGEGTVFNQKTDYRGFSMGASINKKVGINDLRIDYSWQSFPYETIDGSIMGSHSIAMTYGWGGIPDYSRYDISDYLSESSDEEKIGQPPVIELEIFNPPPDSDIQPPIIDKDTEFDSRSYSRFDIEMDMADISALNFKRIVFYVRPQEIIKTNYWKLYVFQAKIKNWDNEEIDRWALKVIEGKGIPPMHIVWDGVSQDGTLLPEGKYYYILTAVDAQGQNFATKWHKFRLE